MQKRVLITGGAGFIGSYVSHLLLEKGYAVTVFDNLSQGKKENIPLGASFVQGDIGDVQALQNVIKEGDVVFHLAAIVSVPITIDKPLTSYVTNVMGTACVLEAARLSRASGVILSSSAAVYGNQEGIQSENMNPAPNSPYGLHKLQNEELGRLYSELYNLPVTALRYFNVYGKGHHETGSYAPVIARFLKAKKEGKPFPIIGNGNQTRDFIHVTDVAEANYKAMLALEEPTFKVCNVCSGKTYSVNTIAQLIDSNHPVEYLPPRIEIQDSCGDIRHTETILGWKATIPLERGIAELL